MVIFGSATGRMMIVVVITMMITRVAVISVVFISARGISIIMVIAMMIMRVVTASIILISDWGVTSIMVVTMTIMRITIRRWVVSLKGIIMMATRRGLVMTRRRFCLYSLS